MYTLIADYDPCYIFQHFKVTEMHGLSLSGCKRYNNTREDAYISGFTNLSPIDNKPFVFINLSRCTDDIKTFGLLFHEMMHLSSIIFNGDWENKEEEMITFAENEAYEAFDIINEVKF